MIKLEYEIAKRYLKSKRKESFVSFISIFALVGIMLGVATLIIVMSVMNGFREQIVANIVGINGHVFVTNKNNKITKYNELIDSIKKNKDVISIHPSVQEQAMISSVANSVGVVVDGLTYEDLISRKLVYTKLREQNTTDFKNNKDVAIIGRIIARNLNLQIGDTFTIIVPNGYSTALGTIPKFMGFTVVDILDSGMYQYDSSMVIIPFKSAQRLFNYGTAARKIDIFVKDPQNTEGLRRYIYTNTNIDYVETWQDSNRYLINALEVERNVMFLILSLLILIATFNIVSGLIILVRSKTKEVAILRTIGFSRKSIAIVFLLIGLRIGVIGTILGGILGVMFSLNIDTIKRGIEALSGSNLFAEEIYFLSKLPASVQSFQVILILIISIIFAILSSVYPALRASKIKPIEGLKYE